MKDADTSEPCRGCGELRCMTCDGYGWVYDPSDGGTMCCPDCDGEHKCHDDE